MEDYTTNYGIRKNLFIRIYIYVYVVEKTNIMSIKLLSVCNEGVWNLALKSFIVNRKVYKRRKDHDYDDCCSYPFSREL